MIVIIQGNLAERIYWLAEQMKCSPTEAVAQAVIDQEELVDTLADGGGPIEPNQEARDAVR